MFFFFLINGADKTNKAKCRQNKAELFPAFDSLAGKVPIRTPTFLQNPHALLLSNNVFEVELAQEIQLFLLQLNCSYCFCVFFLALYLCDRLRVLSVRKEAALVWKRQHSHYMAQLFGGLKNNNTKRYYDRNFRGKMVSKDKRKGLPTKTRNINPLCGSEINTSK